MHEGKELGKLDIEALKKARQDGKKIGLVQGSWDQFHIGHLKYIKIARENCGYLIVGVDSDAKIQERKGKNRPLIPEEERYETIKELGVAKIGTYEYGKSIADDIVIKPANGKKWELIKEVRPDILITITENYTIEEYNELTKICGSVLVLPRQADTSTSAKLRKKLIANMSDKVDEFEKKHSQSINETIKRLKLNEQLEEPLSGFSKYLNDSTDWITPVVAAIKIKDRWYYGTNQCDHTLSKNDLNNRTELFYSTSEHAEINLLKRIGNCEKIDSPIWTTLFPCDKCMKVLISKGIKKIYYLEDHPERNWSKRSHELAKQNGIETINLLNDFQKEKEEEYDFSKYKYIFPPNARNQEQLDIMLEKEARDEDPLDPNIIEQPILFSTNNWYVTQNRFPHQGNSQQFLIISLQPIYKIEDISKEMWKELKEIWLKLKETYNLTGGALCFRYGDPVLSGASLKRLHAHIITPNVEEKVRFPIGGHKTLKRELNIKPNSNK